MSRSKKTAIIVAVGCIAVGIAVVFAAVLWIGGEFTLLNTMHFEDKTYTITEDFQHIDIRDVEGDIRLIPATDGQCRIVCKESDKILHTVSVTNDTLVVTRTDTRRWFERIGIWWSENPAVTVSLPEKTYLSLYLKSVSGNIEVPDDLTFVSAELLTTSGNITFSAHTSEGLSAKSTSGRVKVKNAAGGVVKVVTVSGEMMLSDTTAGALTVKTTSGDMTLSGIAADTLKAETTSGDMELSTVSVSGTAELKAVSGDIEMERIDAGSLRMQTVSGDVKGCLLSPKNFSTDTVSGNIHVPASDPSAGSCRITTTSGDINIYILT